MRVKSPLSNLSDTINQVKDSAVQYRETLQRNEAATRAVLIDPILQALGWDTANTYMVEVERSFEQTRVDYALYDRNSNVRIVVEAKALGSNLEDRTITMNVIKYAFTYDIQDVFLTDGLVWVHITSFQPGNITQKIINFSQDDPVDCAVYLVQGLDAARFWPEEQTIDVLAQRVTQLESVVATLQKDVSQLKIPQLIQTIPTQADRSTSPSTSSVALPTAVENRPFVDLNMVEDIAKTRPSLLRLPDGTVIKVSVWKDVLVECCKFALITSSSIAIPLPDRSGRKVRLFDIVKPRLGIAFVQEEYKGQTIYIYTNYDSGNCVANAEYILNKVPPSAQKLKAGIIFSKKQQ